MLLPSAHEAAMMMMLKLPLMICRKKLIEALREGDRDLIASMAQGQEALKSNLEGTTSGLPDIHESASRGWSGNHSVYSYSVRGCAALP